MQQNMDSKQVMIFGAQTPDFNADFCKYRN